MHQIESTGCGIAYYCRYLRAVSVEGDSLAKQKAMNLPFVMNSRPVMSILNEPELRTYDTDSISKPNHNISDREDFGVSWLQTLIVNVPAVHDRGYAGEEVLIGVQDAGFDNLNHECFSRLNVIATWDFVNNDENVGDEEDMGFGYHGTRTLSVIAGLDSGRFIGAAPGADFVLTKTENSTYERRIEEDDWVAGLWFHDSLGTQVLSSSLSYRDWYDYEDIDGETAVTSRAADSAAAAGIVIVNSAGNTGRRGHPENKIGAPADARNVISVGGIIADSSYWADSSIGPTYDGRIKPDVVALSSGVYTANNYSNTGYISRRGTSYSCPMIAGVAALILDANADLSQEQVMTILQESSHQADDPDTLFGYGIPDALAAVIRAEELSVRKRPISFYDLSFTINPNPFNESSQIHYFLNSHSLVKITVHDIQGRWIKTLADKVFNAGEHTLIFPGLDLPSGQYFIKMEASNKVGYYKATMIR